MKRAKKEKVVETVVEPIVKIDESNLGIGKLVLIGNDPKCSRCNAFKPTWDDKKFIAFAKVQGVEMIDAGQARFPIIYNTWMANAKKLKVTVKAFPDLIILDKAGKLIGHYNPKGDVPTTITTIKKICADYCNGNECTPIEPKTIVCPNCNGTGKITVK